MELPELGLDESWCCANGCGDCSPTQIDFEYSRTTDHYGNVLESKTEKIWASDCCRAELLLWDEKAQDFKEYQK